MKRTASLNLFTSRNSLLLSSRVTRSSAQYTSVVGRSKEWFGSQAYSTENNSDLPQMPKLPKSTEEMLMEIQTLGKLSATVKRSKGGDENGPGVSVTVAGNGRLDKVRIDDDLAGDLQSIEKLVVEAYLAARVAVFENMQQVVSDRLRKEKERGL